MLALQRGDPRRGDDVLHNVKSANPGLRPLLCSNWRQTPIVSERNMDGIITKESVAEKSQFYQEATLRVSNLTKFRRVQNAGTIKFQTQPAKPPNPDPNNYQG